MKLLRFYKDDAEEHRWRVIETQNGKKLADSAEGYKNYQDCLEMARDLFPAIHWDWEGAELGEGNRVKAVKRLESRIYG